MDMKKSKKDMVAMTMIDNDTKEIIEFWSVEVAREFAKNNYPDLDISKFKEGQTILV